MKGAGGTTHTPHVAGLKTIARFEVGLGQREGLVDSGGERLEGMIADV